MLGIDVKDTKEVKIKDAKFTIGVVSYATRLNLTKTSIQLAEGDKQVTDTFTMQIEYVKYGVKSHSGIVNKKGEEIECKHNPDGTLSEETLNLYLACQIVPTLFSEIFSFNNITGDQEKN